MTELMEAPLLVVEDEPAVMAFVLAVLRREGFAVESAPSGVAALEMLAEREFGGVITDMRMPGGVDGAEVYDWLKVNRPPLANRFLFITGDTVSEETARTLRRTGVPFVEKPFRMGEFLTVVQKVMGGCE